MESEPTQPVGFRQSPMPMESSDGIAQLVNPTKTRGYRWGKFQGWVILVFGALDLLDGHPILLGNMYGRLGGILLVITGIGLINRAKEGLVLFFICNGALLAGFLWTFRFSILSFDFESMAGAPLALLALLLAWFGPRWERRELSLLVYPAMLLGGYRLLTADIHQGDKVALFLSLLMLGTVATIVHRLKSQPRLKRR